MTILITGVAGFIGSNLAKWILINTDYKIVGIDDLSGGYIENLPPQNDRFKFFNNNVCNPEQLDLIFTIYKPTIVYHLAAFASEGRSNHIRRFVHYNNTISSCNVINSCINHNCKLVFTSSVAVYSGTPPYTELTPPVPIDEYGLSKFVTEESIKIAGLEQGLRWCIIRPRNVYGMGQNLFDQSRNLFGICCYNALNNLPINIFGDGTNRRAFTYIDDIIEPLFNAGGIENEIINLGSGKNYTINEAIQVFSEVSGYKNIKHIEPRHEVPEAYCLTEKSEEMLEFKEKTDLQEGLYEMWYWAKKQRMRPLINPPALEVTQNAHVSLR